MDEMFDKIKEQANKAKDSAIKITKNVIDKTNNVINQTKINFAISEAEGKVNDIYKEIGKAVYEKYKDTGEIFNGMEEKCGKLDAILEEIQELKEHLSELKETVKCNSCGSYNHVDDLFCSKCGESLNCEDEVDERYDDDDDDVVIIKAKKPESKEE